jgi:hypothetical protein
VDVSASTRHFETLPQALHFIADLIEKEAPAEMEGQFAHIQHPANPKYHDPGYFARRVFPQLQKHQQEIDFRRRYEDRQFPADHETFKLGGHFRELGCIHMDFTRTEQGWVIDDIWECR